MIRSTAVGVRLEDLLVQAVLTRIRAAARSGAAPKTWRCIVPPYVSTRATEAILALLESARRANILSGNTSGICEVMLEVVNPIPDTTAVRIYRNVSPRALRFGSAEQEYGPPTVQHVLLECGDCRLEVSPEGVYRLTYRLRVGQTPLRVRHYGGYTVDGKSRVVVPADFRNQWEGPIVLARGPRQTIIAASLTTWLAIESLNQDPLEFQASYGITATKEETDPASGRIVLPHLLRTAGKIAPGNIVVYAGCVAAGLLIAAEESIWTHLDETGEMADVLREVQNLLPTF